WRPAIYIEAIVGRDCQPEQPFPVTGECDCNCLQSPQDYQMAITDVVGPERTSDSRDNYLEILCCIVDRVNLIFRLLQILDCCIGNRFQAWNNWLLSNHANAGGQDIVTVVNCLVAQVQALTGVNCAPQGVAVWPDQCIS